MCRLVAYLGPHLLLEDVLVKPVNSIVMQSLHSRESSMPTNGDGFGLGWYAPEIDATPALFRSIFPAWGDVNLLNLTAKIKSPLFFGHVRASSGGGVTQFNCHPFVHDRWMLMHNGEIANFMAVKRHLRHLLDDDIYNWIQGETDSEHLFALFLQLGKGKDLSQLSVVGDVLEATFTKVVQLIKKYGKPAPSYFNICLTDGKRLFISRYCTDKNIMPETMHYALGSHFVAKNRHYHMLKTNGKPQALLVASEKLTDFDAEWHDVPVNKLIMIDADLSIQVRDLG